MAPFQHTASHFSNPCTSYRLKDNVLWRMRQRSAEDEGIHALPWRREGKGQRCEKNCGMRERIEDSQKKALTARWWCRIQIWGRELKRIKWIDGLQFATLFPLKAYGTAQHQYCLAQWLRSCGRDFEHLSNCPLQEKFQLRIFCWFHLVERKFASLPSVEHYKACPGEFPVGIEVEQPKPCK